MKKDPYEYTVEILFLCTIAFIAVVIAHSDDQVQQWIGALLVTANTIYAKVSRGWRDEDDVRDA